MIVLRVLFIGSMIFMSQAYSVNNPFSWTDCFSGHPENKAVEVTELRISPQPITIPGNVRLSIQANILQPIHPSALFNIDVHKKSPNMGEIRIPCVNFIFKCNYDVCGLVDQTLNSRGSGDNGLIYQALHKFVLTGANLNCPIQPQTIGIADFVIPVNYSQALMPIILGEYRVKVTLLDVVGVELGCIQIHDVIEYERKESFLFGLRL